MEESSVKIILYKMSVHYFLFSGKERKEGGAGDTLAAEMLSKPTV